ncbi:MAG TPA: hypothetical protein VGH65_09270, partial [Verrucomicrobiaceae bacterium]
PDGETDAYEARVFDRNLAAVSAGVERLQTFRGRVAATLAELRAHPDWKVVLWGANDNLVKMLPGRETLPNALLVDSDPRKTNYHPAMNALLPGDALDALRSADRLILFTRLHASQILHWIEEHAGRRFDDAVIVDY